MQLPKISYPTLTIEVPGTEKSYMFRPLLVKEEKILLMAKVSEDENDILQAIRQVVNNCSLDPTFDVDKLPLFALEYVFLKLRGFSIGEDISVAYRDYEDDKVYEFNINLNDIKVKFPETDDKVIKINDKAGLVMKYPSATLYADKGFLQSVGEESYYKLIVRCIGEVYDEDSVFNASEFEEKDLLEFIELLDIKNFEKISHFMSTLPSLHYEIKYTNSLGNERTIELKKLADFFTLR